MVRKVISIFFYILSGFFIYAVCLIAFISIPQMERFKFVIMGIFAVPAIIFLVIGGALCRFQNWRSSTGITLLSGVGVNLLVVITFISLLLTPEFKEFFPENEIASFNDYFLGFSAMVFLAALGGFLLLMNNRKMKRSTGDALDDVD